MTIINNLSIGLKTVIIYVVSTVFIVGILLVGLLSMSDIKKNSQTAFQETFLEAQMLMDLKADFEDVRIELLTLMNEPDKEKYFHHKQIIDDISGAIDERLEYMLSENIAFDIEARTSIVEIRSEWEAFSKTRDTEIMPAIYDGRLIEARQVAVGVQEERFQKFTGLSMDLVEHEKAETVEAQEDIGNKFDQAIRLYWVFISTGVVFLVVSFLYVSRGIVGRLRRIERVVSVYDPDQGDLKIEVDGKDEIGSLAESFNIMSRRLFEDRVVQKQYMMVMENSAEQREKKALELEILNGELVSAQDQLTQKNLKLEEYIEEIKESHKELEESKAQIIQSEKMASIGQLAAGVAHEINNPVGFINSNLNTLEEYISDLLALISMYGSMDKLLADKRLDDSIEALNKVSAFKQENDLEFTISDAEELIKESRVGVNRVIGIVKSLKDFSHADEGVKEEYDINQCLEDTLKVAWHEIKYKAEVKKEFGELPVVVCNHSQINQVLLNIIVNASQAMPERGLISIKTCMENENVVIKIADNGEGMSEHTVKKIFDPFFTTKPVGKGTGLGLSIAYGIITEHKGVLEVESEMGVGTTFIIKLPVQTESTPGCEEDRPAQSQKGGVG